MQISTIATKINFYSEGIDFVLPQKGKIRNWIADILHSFGYTLSELNFIFVSDEHLYQMNVSHLQHEYYTDIMTFPYHEPDSKQIHSDIYISIDRVGENAKIVNVDFLEELHRVMIHGVLHMMGFDDHEEEDKKRMKQQEDSALSKRVF